MTSYSTLIETMRLCCTVFELLLLISHNLKMLRDCDGNITETAVDDIPTVTGAICPAA